MEIQWISFGVVLVLNAMAALLIAGLLARRSGSSGRRAMIYLLASLAIWSFAYGMITFSPGLEAKRFWLRIENIGILAQPVLWFVFTLRYSSQGNPPARPYLAALCIIPFISLVMIFSDRWFHLYYVSIRPLMEAGGPLVIGRGPWYWVALTQSYLLNGFTTVILIWRFVQYRNIFRRQLGVLILAVLIPWLINILYQLVSNFAPSFSVPIDFTPVSFTLSTGLISVGIFRTHLLDLVPIARDVVMEHIPELVFVVDAHDRVLDANSVAEKWLGKSKDEMIGRDPMDVFQRWPQFVNRLLSTEQTREVVQIPGEPARMLEIVVTPLYDTTTRQLNGRVIVAHDITESKQLEKDLLDMNDILWDKIDEVNSLQAQLKEQAIRDSLTGVFNRRFLSESIEVQIAQAERDHTPVSIVMMDIDHFKKFNDTHGHKCGDHVLTDFSAYLVEHSREGDIVCRYGGEEFVILMPNATRADARERAEAWRQGYAARIIHFEGQALNTTFSAGVASYPADGSTGEAILHAADEALYLSKSLGRNRVTVFTREQTGENEHAN